MLLIDICKGCLREKSIVVRLNRTPWGLTGLDMWTVKCMRCGYTERSSLTSVRAIKNWNGSFDKKYCVNRISIPVAFFNLREGSTCHLDRGKK